MARTVDQFSIFAPIVSWSLELLNRSIRGELARPGRVVGLCYSQMWNNLKEPRREEIMAAYVIYNQLEVTDPNAWEEYRSKIRALLADFDARVIAADPEPKVLEGEWTGTRNVIIEFPDMDTVERWHNSDEYKPLLDMRLGAARGNVIGVNGV